MNAADELPDPHDLFPVGFFSRADERPDDRFYESDRLVTHIDDRAIRAIGRLYEHLGITGRVLDLMSSWVSHFRTSPAELTVLGMNAHELAANVMATERIVHDLNLDPTMPFDANRFDATVCCVSIDYLIRPIDVIRDVARVVVPGGLLICTFSNRCFPTKAIRGWLSMSDEQHCRLVVDYIRLAGGWAPAEVALCTPPKTAGDPLYAVWARRGPDGARAP